MPIAGPGAASVSPGKGNDMQRKIVKQAVLAATLAVTAMASPAQATEFFGSGTATAMVGPNPVCAPLPFQGIATGSGSSAFGTFTYGHTSCTSGATGPVFGSFLFDFGIDQFSGTFDGTSAATATAGLFDLSFIYTITAGTGRFADGTGAFSGIGTVDVRGGPPSRLSLAFSAVPEPGTWATMLIGFGAIGGAMRRRRRQAAGASLEVRLTPA